mmetsp:Transcript_36927/g.63754  ORF Transcript_36927/g.63754 Transcript_36927/m.63754 type:complete len:381 (-) Transcript_36927:105-1247(-)
MTQSLNFPARIYQILENESAEIIQWNANGLSFRIVDHIRFEAEVIPRYFRHKKISSVQRQLNVYGFRSISRGEHKRSFYHPIFKRGNWELVKQMGRYLPANKNDKGPEVDESHIASAINSLPVVLGKVVPGQVQVKNDNTSLFVSNYATPQAYTMSHQNNQQFTPSAPISKKNATQASSGTVKVMVDTDLFSAHHFAADFYACSDAGTEHTGVTLQPVDYSIPMLFPTAPRGAHSTPAAEVAVCDEANSSSSSVYYTAPNPLRGNYAYHAQELATQSRATIKQDASRPCDWAVPDASVEAWSEMNFDLDCVDASTLLEEGLKEDVTPKTSDFCSFDFNMPPEQGWDGSYGFVGDICDVSALEKCRRDSFDDVFALCAELF